MGVSNSSVGALFSLLIGHKNHLKANRLFTPLKALLIDMLSFFLRYSVTSSDTAKHNK